MYEQNAVHSDFQSATDLAIRPQKLIAAAQFDVFCRRGVALCFQEHGAV